ncbi:HEAT repeat domain-containing protein [Oryzomonas japonica]|uniref:HEAT repeat domain-containing protein n=1 Tax=Oryzomonas japonica TaxID=2603858 RepID=A0A7J4ZQY6_9BACT|nr:HEAT repeat domain-containing protein [Oryzomonas japonica]
MTRALKIDKSLRERRRIIRLLDFLKRDDLTGDQMERIGRRLQKSGKRALNPLVRKLWQEHNGTAIYRYTCMLDFFDASAWMDQLIQITIQRKDLEEDGKLALLDLLHDSGIDVTAPPFASLTGYGAASLDGFIDDCLKDGERGLVRFIDNFLDVTDDFRERMIHRLAELNSPDAVALLEILLSFERPEIVREAILALGRIKSGCALDVLTRAERRHEGDVADLIRRSIRRLSFLGIKEPTELPQPFPMPLPFHDVQAGPIDFYGARSLWFAWKLDDSAFAALLILTGESDGLLNAVSYRMRDEKEYNLVLKDLINGEMLLPVDPGYALASLREALHRSREQGFYLPPDFYVDMRLFRPDSLKPEAYIPRFSLNHLDGIVEKIPGYVMTSNELLDDPSLEGWILSEPAVYDAAERFMALEEKDGVEGVTAEALEAEINLFCDEMVIPRRAEIIKRLLLTADYMQQTGSEDDAVQRTLATALSLVGGFLPESRHPFIRRLVLDSVDTARQALAEGYDLRLEEGYTNDEE